MLLSRNDHTGWDGTHGVDDAPLFLFHAELVVVDCCCITRSCQVAHTFMLILK